MIGGHSFHLPILSTTVRRLVNAAGGAQNLSRATWATQLQRLHLHHIKSHLPGRATMAAEQHRSHVDESETILRENRIEHRARFPVLKILEKSWWSWPRKINHSQIQNLFRLAFLATYTDVDLIGVAARHLSIALGHAACLKPLTCDQEWTFLLRTIQLTFPPSIH
jgi:hypothetical protein